MDKKKVDVFVSRPTKLDPKLESAYTDFHDHLASQDFNLRRLGGGIYSKKAPLRAVIDLINHCCGAIILGYPQLEFLHSARQSTNVQNEFHSVYPTPWNQIEGALAYASGSPVLVIAHTGIEGGIFDHGITGEGVLHIDLGEPNWHQKLQFSQPFEEWTNEVEVYTKQRSLKP